MDSLALRQRWIEDGIGPWARPSGVRVAQPTPPASAPRPPATGTSWGSPHEAARARTLMAAKGSTPEAIAWFLDGDL